VAPASANATGAIAAALVVTTIAVAASQEPSTAPALESERTIAEQDCTQPIDLTAGNLRCR
jgi:hypothetical protein